MHNSILICDAFFVFDKDGIFLGKLVLEVCSGYILCYKIFFDPFSIWIHFHPDKVTGSVMLCSSVSIYFFSYFSTKFSHFYGTCFIEMTIQASNKPYFLLIDTFGSSYGCHYSLISSVTS